jgi:hypothetical protein
MRLPSRKRSSRKSLWLTKPCLRRDTTKNMMKQVSHKQRNLVSYHPILVLFGITGVKFYLTCTHKNRVCMLLLREGLNKWAVNWKCLLSKSKKALRVTLCGTTANAWLRRVFLLNYNSSRWVLPLPWKQKKLKSKRKDRKSQLRDKRLNL